MSPGRSQLSGASSDASRNGLAEPEWCGRWAQPHELLPHKQTQAKVTPSSDAQGTRNVDFNAMLVAKGKSHVVTREMRDVLWHTVPVGVVDAGHEAHFAPFNDRVFDQRARETRMRHCFAE